MDNNNNLNASPHSYDYNIPYHNHMMHNEAIMNQPPPDLQLQMARLSVGPPPSSNSFYNASASSPNSIPIGFNSNSNNTSHLPNDYSSIPASLNNNNNNNNNYNPGASASEPADSLGFGVELYAPPSLEHITSDPESPSYHPPASTSIHFTSQKLINRKEAFNLKDIPFGVLFCPGN